MPVCKECVAGFGHTSSLWFHFEGNQMVNYTIESPRGHDTQPPDGWFQQHMMILRQTPKHLQKSRDVLPYLTFSAGERAVRAIKDYNVYELAIAFTSHYGWQLVNGAKILPTYGELAKVYAGVFAVYLFRAEKDRELALAAVSKEA